MFKKRNPSLIIGFSLPLVMIIVVAISIYIPQMFLHPKYNFLYSTDTDYTGVQIYTVANQHLSEQFPTDVQTTPAPSPQLFVHNVTTNESKAITNDEAKKLTLDPSIESPDGYRLQEGNSNSGFFPFFGGGSYESSQYLVGHNASKRLNLKYYTARYYYPVHFIGWIIQ